MADIQPRPSKTLIVFSALVIAGSLFFVCAFCAAAVDNPMLWGANVFFLPLLLLLAIQQYCGTFRRAPSGAMWARAIFYALGGLGVFGLITTIVEGLQDGSTLWAMRWLVFFISLFAVACVALGRMNSAWSRTLRAAAARGDLPAPSWRFSLREMLLLFAVVAAIMGLTSYLIQSIPPNFAEHVDRSSAPFSVPSDATDVSYCRRPSGSTYEFSTSEQAFRGWVASIGSFESQSADVPLREITTPFTIVRYDGSTVTIRDGLYYSWSDDNQYNGIDAAFDRASGRAYYDSYFD